MTSSEAAKARGTVGFLKPVHEWKVIATLNNGPDGQEVNLTTTNKRDARRRYDMIVKYIHEPHGKYSGCSVTLTCDMETVAEYKAIP